MSEILIQSKITAPRLNSKIVHRDGLTAQLNENISKSLIIVCAPAGFGKTTLVLDYLTSYNSKHTWFSIPHKGIEDASTFFEYLISSVNNINEEFGKSTLEVLKQFASSPKMSKELVYACTASFINEFQKCFKEDVILVIDDVHYIESDKTKAGLKEFFTEILDNIPANLHLIIVSRVMPDINLTTLKAKRNVFIIDEKELNFSKEETEKLLKDVYKFEFVDKDIKVLDENIKGWITGLHLLLQAYGEDFAKVKYKGKLDTEIIFDFFAQEIFDNLSPELQEFMMVTSLIESFDEDLSNAVLGIDNSKQLTEELIRKNLFIHQIRTIEKDKKDGKISYGYHALFRDFLNKRLQSSRIVQEIKKLMEKIGDSYENSGDEMSAVNYFLEAENYDKAVLLIIKNNGELYDSGKYDILWKWCKSFPEDFINSNAELLHLISFLYCYLNGEYDKALCYLDKSEKLFYKSKKNENGIFRSFEIKCVLLIRLGKLDEAKIQLEKVYNSNLNKENIIFVCKYLSEIYTHLGKYQKNFQVLEKSLSLCDKFGLDKTNIYKEMGTSHMSIGEYQKAIIYYKKSFKDNDSINNLISNNANIARAYMQNGNYSKSIKYFNYSLKLVKKSYSKLGIIGVSRLYALLFQFIGDFEESNKILDSIYPIVLKENMIFESFYVTDSQFINYYYLSDKEKSTEYLNLNKLYTEELNIEQYRKMHEYREIMYLMKYDFNSSLEKRIINLYEYFNTIKFYDKDTVLAVLVIYYLKTNNQERALKYLTNIIKVALNATDIIPIRNLIDFALSRPELAQYKDKVHCAFTEFFDRLNIEGTSDEYKRKMKIEIDNLYDIRMTAFGGLEFVSRGVHIPESKWRKKKGKSILAYMMLNPKAKYNKDKLIEMFFPDGKPDTVEDSFRQGVFNIRNAFKNPYLSFLIQESKNIYLNPDCYFKSDAEEFDKYRKIARSPERNRKDRIQAIRDAVELYKGEFMEGNYEPWCEDIRSDFHNKFISISELLLDLLSEEKNYEEIILYSEKLLKHDKLNEKAYHSLVEAYVSSERRKSAKEIYLKMMNVYEEELSEKPDEKILKKIEILLGI